MKKTKIIDRTIIELVNFYVNNTTDPDSRDVFAKSIKKFILFMQKLGVNYQEINLTTLLLMQGLPKDVDYVYRIKKEKDFHVFKKYDFKKIIIKLNDLSVLKDNYFNDNFGENHECILEIEANSFREALKVLEENEYKNWIHFINCIKIIGLSEELPHKAAEVIQEFRNAIGMNIELDILVEDRHASATAFSIESYNNGVEYITTSFCGFHYQETRRWAPFEEVVMALNFIYGMNIQCDSNILPYVKKIFENITRKKIEKNKPVIGENIFKCESGIHVDGLYKNSSTYEPFNPEVIGQRREFVLGKHSGSTGLALKLNELKINYTKEEISIMLNKIREISILSKGLIDNEMIFNMVNELRVGN